MGFKNLFIFNDAGDLNKIQDKLTTNDYDSYLKAVMDNGASFKIRKEAYTYFNPDIPKIEYFELTREIPFDKLFPEIVIARTMKKPRDILFALLEKDVGYISFGHVDECQNDVVIYQLNNGLEYIISKAEVYDYYVFNSSEVFPYEYGGEEINYGFNTLKEAMEFAKNFTDFFYLNDDQLQNKYYNIKMEKEIKYSVKQIGTKIVVRNEGENYWIEEEIDLPLN